MAGVASIRGVRVLPEAHRLVTAAVPAQRAVAWLSAAAVIGLVVGLVTGWPVAGLASGVGALFGPTALGGGGDDTPRRKRLKPSPPGRT